MRDHMWWLWLGVILGFIFGLLTHKVVSYHTQCDTDTTLNWGDNRELKG